MTDVDDVLYELHRTAKAGDGGIAGVARRTGRREVYLRQKLQPHDDSHQLTLLDAIAVMDDTRDTAPLERLCEMYGGRFTSRTQAVSESVLEAVLQANREHGDIAAAVLESIADGRVTVAERMRVRREIEEARRALDILSNTFDEVFPPA